MPTVRPADLSPEKRALLSTPYGFAKYILKLPVLDAEEPVKVGTCSYEGADFYEVHTSDKQRRVLDDIIRKEPGDKPLQAAQLAVRTCNGCGKTSVIIPAAVLWAMAYHPRMKVVITSGVDRQVREQIFPALHAHKNKLEGWDFQDASISAPNGSRCVGFSTRQGGYFEGWHGNKDELYDLLQHDGPLMIIVDEAKSVPPQIFDAIDRCTYQFLLLVSSPGGPVGRFHDACNKDKAYYRQHQIRAEDCPYVDHAKNAQLIARRGLNDPLVRSKIFAEFMDVAEGAIMNYGQLNRCNPDQQQERSGQASYYCDFAAGGDENVFARTRGNRASIIKAWQEKDTMRAVAEFIRLFRAEGLNQADVALCVSGDNDGLGKVIIDRLHEMGLCIQRDHANAAADKPDAYYNRSAETWFEGAKRIENGEVIIDTDETTRAQLTSRKEKPRADGRLQLESKQDMRERGVGSPDRADALLGSMRTPRDLTPRAFAGASSGNLIDQMRYDDEGEALEIAGCTAE